MAKIDVSKTIILEKGVEESLSSFVALERDVWYEKLQNDWETCSENILAEVSRTTPDFHKSVSEIIIHPSVFGTSGSYLLPSKSGLVEIFIRKGGGVSAIVELIVSSLVEANAERVCTTWSEKEAVVDFLLTGSSIANELKSCGFGKYTPTLKATRELQLQSVKKTSDEYLAKLGFSSDKEIIQIKNGKLFIRGKPVNGLKQKQIRVITKLIEDKRISTDKLADILFSSDDDYSLYAMSKFIQRLRDTLETKGVTSSIVRTVRNYGYALG